MEPGWQEEPVKQPVTVPKYTQHLVVLCETGEVSAADIEGQMNGVKCLALQSRGGVGQRFEAYAIQVFEEIQKIFRDKFIGKALVQIISANRGGKQVFTGLSGLLKTAGLENPKIYRAVDRSRLKRKDRRDHRQTQRKQPPPRRPTDPIPGRETEGGAVDRDGQFSDRQP